MQPKVARAHSGCVTMEVLFSQCKDFVGLSGIHELDVRGASFRELSRPAFWSVGGSTKAARHSHTSSSSKKHQSSYAS